MSRYEIDESAHSSAPRPGVWAVLADARSWDSWGAWSKSAIEREGHPPPGGLGARKALTRFPFVSREEVTAFEPPSRLGYALLSGMPLRGYSADVTLTEADGGGTEIRWRSRFEVKIPGTGALLRRGLAKFTADAAERLAAEAERQAATGSGRPPAPSHSRP